MDAEDSMTTREKESEGGRTHHNWLESHITFRNRRTELTANRTIRTNGVSPRRLNTQGHWNNTTPIWATVSKSEESKHTVVPHQHQVTHQRKYNGRKWIHHYLPTRRWRSHVPQGGHTHNHDERTPRAPRVQEERRDTLDSISTTNDEKKARGSLKRA